MINDAQTPALPMRGNRRFTAGGTDNRERSLHVGVRGICIVRMTYVLLGHRDHGQGQSVPQRQGGRDLGGTLTV